MSVIKPSATFVLAMVLFLGSSLPTSALEARDDAERAGLAQISESVASLPVDLERDGDTDVVWNRHARQPAQLFYNDGNGGFQERFDGLLRARVDRHQCAAADVDRNGFIDIYCVVGARGGTQTKANELWMQRSDGTFVNRASAYGVSDPYGRGRTATFLDVNGDGWKDLYVVNFFPRSDGLSTTNRFYLNQGGASFKSAPEYGLDEEVGGLATIPGCVQAADYDRDGHRDVLDCAKRGLRLYRYIAARNQFANVAPALGIDVAVKDAALADLNDDGTLDLLTVRRSEVAVRLGTGSGTFAAASFSRKLTAGRDAAIGESNGDGQLDFYVVQGQTRTSQPNPPDLIFMSTATGWRLLTMPQTSAGCGSSAAVLDYDSNGYDDYLVSNGCLGLAGPTMLIAFG